MAKTFHCSNEIIVVSKGKEDIGKIAVLGNDGKFDPSVIPLIDELQDQITKEVGDRSEADKQLQANIDAEVSARTVADQQLQDQITKEADGRNAADKKLQASIDTEASARTAADQQLQDQITKEAGERNETNKKLQASIDTEASARTAADQQLQDQITKEVDGRSDADKQLQANIDAEFSARILADHQLQDQITKETSSQSEADRIYTDEKTQAVAQTAKAYTDTSVTNATTQLNTAISNAITTAEIAAKTEISSAISELVTKTTAPGVSGVSPLKDYIDKGDFLNSPPRVGFLGEKNVSINSAFNMSYFSMSETPFWIITDSEGREVLYFTASSDPTIQKKLFKASRMSVNNNFVFGNDPIVPAYMASGDYPIGVVGLGNTYIAYSASIGGNINYHLVITNGTSNQEKWTTYKDITNIASTGNVSSVMYFEDYGTIATVTLRRDATTSHYIKVLNLYNYNDLSLIKSVDLFDFTANFNYEDYTPYNFYFCGNGGAAYVKNKEHLVLNYSKITWMTNPSGIRSYKYMLITNIFDLPIEFFKDGSGKITNLIDNSEYKISGGKGATDSPGSYCTYTMAYDEYEDCLRTAYVGQGGTTNTIYDVSTLSQPLTTQYAFAANKYRLDLNTPDTCPWAKIQYTSKIMGNNLYMQCYSNTYSDTICAAQYSSNGTSTLQVVGGSWWLPTKVETPDIYSMDYNSIQCIRLDSATTKWIYTVAGSEIKEITFSDFKGSDGVERTGKRALIATSYPAPPVPSLSIYTTLLCWYHPGLNKIYYLVNDVTASDISKQGYVFLLEYNVATATYKERRDNLPAEWTNACLGSKNSLTTTARMIISSNVFIDVDGSMYFSFSGGVVGGRGYFNNYKATPQSDGSVVITALALNRNTWPYANVYTSYDSNFGYCQTCFSNYTATLVLCSKDYVNKESEKTASEFFNGSYYTVSIGLSGSTGLIAYLQETPIFLGGYYSIIPAQEIYLKPNSDNYIYLVRDRYDRSKVNVEVRKRIIGVEGENAFNRVLAAKITTDAANPLSQKNYSIPGTW